MALLGDLQRVFENTYGRRAGVDLERCLVGPARCAELVQRSDRHAEMSDWARFFYYVDGGNLHVALFYGRDMIGALEALDPRRSLGESNVLPFLVFAEELSHAVHTTFAFREGGVRRVQEAAFLQELELMARIDAYLVLRHFVVGLSGRFTMEDRSWARHQAVGRWDVPYDDLAMGGRYRGAARRAARFLDDLEALPPPRQIPELRRFRALSWAGKRARLRPTGRSRRPDA
jgi:hypothetical protein